MQNKKIAVIFGGNSTEYEVSLQSASAVFENINTNKFDIIPIGITRSGEWYHYTGEKEKILNNTWFEDSKNLCPVVVSQNRSVKGFLEIASDKYRIIKVDLVFPVLHGKTAKMVLCRAYLNWQEYLLLAAIHSHQLFVWIRTGHINSLALRVYLFLNR